MKIHELRQTSLDQTGVVILEKDGNQKAVPLFSCEPYSEAQKLAGAYFRDWEIKHIFFTDNIIGGEYKVEEIIEKYLTERNCLPETYMEEVLTGFPCMEGWGTMSTTFCYA